MREEKQFAAEQIWSGGEGALRKSSQGANKTPNVNLPDRYIKKRGEHARPK